MTEPIRIKTFRSKSLQEALQTIRSEFGPDAAVLETKPIRGGLLGLGRNRIEVTASSRMQETLEDDFQETEKAHDEAASPQNVNGDADDAAPTLEEREAHPFQSKPHPHGHREREPRSHLDVSLQRHEGVFARVLQELLDAHIDRSIAEQWIDAAKASFAPGTTVDQWMVRGTIARWIRDYVSIAPTLEIDSSNPQLIAMIGPTGVGKTSTLLKIAATISLEHRATIGILSCDTFRVGSNQLLERHAELMNWPIEIVESANRLPEAIQSLAHCNWILLDTPGCSPGDETARANLNEFLSIAQPTLRQLVLSATTSAASFDRACQWLDVFHPDQLILTKLDESDGLGSLFSSILNAQTPLSFMTHGPNIPSDLVQATATRFAQWVLAPSH